MLRLSRAVLGAAAWQEAEGGIMKRLVVTLMIGAVLGFAGAALAEEDRVERAVREARELQARQNENSDPEVWLRSPDGQKWLKANESRDGKDTSTEAMHVVGVPYEGGAYCNAAFKAWLDAQPRGARGTIVDARNAIGDCADYAIKDAIEKLRRR
jgi:hypothetical protein